MNKDKNCTACHTENCEKSGGWNYRMIRTDDGDEFFFQIYEVYYDKSGKPHSWSAEPISPGGDTPVTVGEDISLMFKAITLPPFIILSDATGKKQHLSEIQVNQATGENKG